MSPYLTHPLRTQKTILHTRRRAVELSRARGWDWHQLTPEQQAGMLAHAEREVWGQGGVG